MFTKRLTIAGVAIALLCSAGAAFADEPGLTKDTIKVGIIGPFSGPASEYSRAQLGAVALMRSVNDAGGIHGRKFEPIIEDDGCDEAKGIAAARKLIFDAKVFLLASAYSCSGPALAAKPVIIESGTPWMIGGAASGELTNPVARTVFQPTATTPDVGHAMVRFALSKPGVKPERIAVISHSNEWAKGYYEGALAELKEKHGAKPVLDLTMERLSTNATPQLLRLREAQPDLVLVILYPAEMSIFLRDAKKFGLNLPFVTGYGVNIEDQIRRTGDVGAVKNLYAAFLMAHGIDTPGIKKWRDIFVKYYPNEQVNSSAFSSMGGVITLMDAIQKIGPDLTREKLVEALNHVKDFDTGVMAGLFNFTPDDHAGQKELSFAGIPDGSKLTIFSAWGKASD